MKFQTNDPKSLIMHTKPSPAIWIIKKKIKNWVHNQSWDLTYQSEREVKHAIKIITIIFAISISHNSIELNIA
jgi:hypothetical protein